MLCGLSCALTGPTEQRVYFNPLNPDFQLANRSEWGKICRNESIVFTAIGETEMVKIFYKNDSA